MSGSLQSTAPRTVRALLLLGLTAGCASYQMPIERHVQRGDFA